MFTKKVIDGDEFCSMPPTTQCLYFHLCMSADDDGFSNSIRNSMFNAHASTDDFNTLVNKRFIIPFESGVIVITHWRMHNYIQNDRYHKTDYLQEKSTLVLQENGVYTNHLDTDCIQNVSKMDTEVSIGKVSIVKDNKKHCAANAQKKFVKPTVEEVNAYCLERNNGIKGQEFIDYYESCGWTVGKNKPMKDWKASVRYWESKRKPSTSQTNRKYMVNKNEDDLSDLWS